MTEDSGISVELNCGDIDAALEYFTDDAGFLIRSIYGVDCRLEHLTADIEMLDVVVPAQ